MTLYLAGLGALFALTACDGLAGEPQVVSTLPPVIARPTIAAQVAVLSGPAVPLYLQNCAPCHGDAGRGDGPVMRTGQIPSIPDLTDPSTMSVHTLEEIYQVITEGRVDKLMPNWNNALSDEQRRDLAQLMLDMRQGQAVAQAQPTATEAAQATEEATVLPAILGVVQGTIRNGTGGAGLDDPDMRAVLHIIDAFFQEVGRVEATVTGDSFEFQDVELRADRGYAVSVTYKGVEFNSALQGGDTALPVLALPVTVYETTSDPSVLKINSLTLYASSTGDGSGDLFLVQLIQMNNTSDRAYVGGVPFTIPQGATWMSESGDPTRYHQEGQTIIDNYAVIPNEVNTIRLHYLFSANAGQSPSIQLPMDYDLNSEVRLLLPLRSYRVESQQLAAQGAQHFQSGVYDSFQGVKMQRGDTLSFGLVALPPSSGPSIAASTDSGLNSQQVVAVVMAVIGAGLLLAAGVLFWRERRLDRSYEGIARRIAALDVAYKAGKLEERQYYDQRDRLKAQLLRMAQPQSGD
jgi:mono/diheme cytochrome c family protein